MILLIDNYDSFSYNLYQLIGMIRPDIKVIRNDAMTTDQIETMAPDAIVLSPGPGRPSEAGICEEVAAKLSDKIPILGICLGHQAICEALGGRITYAATQMHGKTSMVLPDPASRLFHGMKEPIQVARYHSLAADKDFLPECLTVTAQAEDGEIMAVEHKNYPVYGLQFHPESILTPQGRQMIEHFLEEVRHD